jgi:hypothetical protein
MFINSCFFVFFLRVSSVKSDFSCRIIYRRCGDLNLTGVSLSTLFAKLILVVRLYDCDISVFVGFLSVTRSIRCEFDFTHECKDVLTSEPNELSV